MHHDPTCACTALRKAGRAVGRAYDEALAAHGLTTAQFALLRHIARGEPLPLSRLAEQLVMDRSSLYRALEPLEARGLVAVAAGPGKSRLASLSADGRRALDEAEEAWEAVQARLAGAVGEEAWAALHDNLRRVTEAAQGVRA